jgi:hypothetical protein
MDWWMWLLIAVVVVFLLVLTMELPSIRRYMRLKSM